MFLKRKKRKSQILTGLTYLEAKGSHVTEVWPAKPAELLFAPI